jgi:optic atrophy protein 1
LIFADWSVLLSEETKQKIDAMQDELMKVQLKYQKELERLERENKELRKQLLLRENNDTHTKRKIKVKSVNIHLGYEP